jgi:hypothetical protein
VTVSARPMLRSRAFVSIREIIVAVTFAATGGRYWHD